MHATIVGIDRAAGSHQRLRGDLAAECAQWGSGVAVAGEDVAIDAVEGDTDLDLIVVARR